MNRLVVPGILAVSLAGATLFAGCTTATGKSIDQPAVGVAAISTSPVAAVERPITRFIRATGSLMAEDQADVAAEIAGRVIGTPVERGTAVSEGAVLIRVSPAEADAQSSEAEANAAQIEARLGLKPGVPFDVSTVPEVQNAQASFELAQNEFNRIRSLLDQHVVSQSEFDQRRRTARPNSIKRCRRQRRAWRWPIKRSPTRLSVRRLPVWLPSEWCRLATT
jgi:multidrug efflux pump subunit AcrA (membrane-fusion protein)